MKLTLKDLLEQAYVEGWRRAIEEYAVWKDGEQLTAMGRRARDEMAEAGKNCKEPFERWLERQKETF